jgi:UDP-glucose:(heptosyl)LPS alpha-1,3-glucosyltransferase
MKRMKLAFCLFKYFPYGGLQRDFLRIAHTLVHRGHTVHVYTMEWMGEKDPGLVIHEVPASGFQNHTRLRSFVNKLSARDLSSHYDLVVGFNKMPHLDVYYAADVCYKARAFEKHGTFYRLSPRYRQLVAFEKAVFGNGQQTQVLLIAPKQQSLFVEHYQTELSRFHLLPPGISKDRIAPPNAGEIRKKLRDLFHVPPHHFLLLFIGSGFKTKGLDRAIYALSALPSSLKRTCHLFVIGDDHPRDFQRLAHQLNVHDQVHFLGGRPDVPQFLLSGDLLLHPAYHENTGTVLLEALASGLPVLTVDACGYADHVKKARAGVVLSSPFIQATFNTSLEEMLRSKDREQFKQNALSYTKNADIYSLPDKAADIILKARKTHDFSI